MLPQPHGSGATGIHGTAMAKTIFFSVGEPSGDLHGANLIRALRERSNEPIKCVGYGGPKMRSAGADLHFDLTQLAVMGFLQVVTKLPTFFRLLWAAERWFDENQPDAVVLIDFPGFNWKVAKAAKRRGIPVFYYGTPQVWGWAPWRVKRLRDHIDHALCKLPFEESWLRDRGVNATYVGHPYFDELADRVLDDAFVRDVRGKSGPLVTLLPGSRTQEVKANFGDLLAATRRIRERVPEARFAVAAFKEAHAERIRSQIASSGLIKNEGPTVYVERTPELIEASDCCLAVSGSVSLELLHHEKPSAITYRVSRGMHWVQSLFRRVRYITLVNLITAEDGDRESYGAYDPSDPRDIHVLMPEYLHCGGGAHSLADHAVAWLTDCDARDLVVDRMRELRSRIDRPGASLRTADYMLGELAVEKKSRSIAA